MVLFCCTSSSATAACSIWYPLSLGPSQVFLRPVSGRWLGVNTDKKRSLKAVYMVELELCLRAIKIMVQSGMLLREGIGRMIVVLLPSNSITTRSSGQLQSMASSACWNAWRFTAGSVGNASNWQ